MLSCAVLIVTHNSQSVLPACLDALMKQTRLPRQIIVVDSGSDDISYLRQCEKEFPVLLHPEGKNVGFCSANNTGLKFIEPSIKYLLFLNPDAFLTRRFLEQAEAHLDHPEAKKIGALTGLLLGYDVEKKQSTGLIDSTGIFQTWYGRWFDRGQGEACLPFPADYCRAQYVPALCGALMFCRLDALKSAALGPNIVMDPSFFMYKEDIDLSLRLRQSGWSLLYLPDLIAYHCRGWNKNRSLVSKTLRLLSAKNEMAIYKRMKSPFYFYSVLKYWAVKWMNV